MTPPPRDSEKGLSSLNEGQGGPRERRYQEFLTYESPLVSWRLKKSRGWQSTFPGGRPEVQ